MAKKTTGQHYILDDRLERVRDDIMSAECILNNYLAIHEDLEDDSITNAWQRVYAANILLHKISTDLHYALSPLGSYVLACDNEGRVVMRHNKAFDVDTQEFYTMPHDPDITDLVPETTDTNN